MLIKYRFIERLSAVSPVFNTLLTAGDALTDVFAKLQGLLTVRNRRSVRTANITGGANTTADVTLGTLVIPAADIRQADSIRFFVLGDWNKPNSGTNIVRLWVKVNGTLAGIIQYTANTNVTDRPITFEGCVVVRTIAASGSVVGGLKATIHTNATTAVTFSSQGDVLTVDTLNDITITVGIGFSSSNANNRVTAEILNIIQE